MMTPLPSKNFVGFSIRTLRSRRFLWRRKWQTLPSFPLQILTDLSCDSRPLKTRRFSGNTREIFEIKIAKAGAPQPCGPPNCLFYFFPSLGKKKIGGRVFLDRYSKLYCAKNTQRKKTRARKAMRMLRRLHAACCKPRTAHESALLLSLHGQRNAAERR
jgi:hypothetical protein